MLQYWTTPASRCSERDFSRNLTASASCPCLCFAFPFRSSARAMSLKSDPSCNLPSPPVGHVRGEAAHLAANLHGLLAEPHALRVLALLQKAGCNTRKQ